jgi:hypothetical protein
VDAPTAPVSSTSVRARLGAGLSIEGLVLPGVEAHILKHRLYQSDVIRGSDDPRLPIAGDPRA